MRAGTPMSVSTCQGPLAAGPVFCQSVFSGNFHLLAVWPWLSEGTSLRFRWPSMRRGNKTNTLLIDFLGRRGKDHK